MHVAMTSVAGAFDAELLLRQAAALSPSFSLSLALLLGLGLLGLIRARCGPPL